MKIDIASDTWSTTRKACEAGIAAATERLMRTGLQPHEYDAERGAIAAYRAILALAEPLKVAPVDYSKSKDRSGI
ncbi:MAG: hypothetical protein E5W25_19915 [Mesorhizobium sp.]|nr:MAG: hypothetical protein E5W25_19915 [Mesorhizobium sp.]